MPTFTSVPGTNVDISLGNGNTNTNDGSGGDGGGGDGGGYDDFGGGVIAGVPAVMDYATDAPTDPPATDAPVATADPTLAGGSSSGGLSVLDATSPPTQDPGTFFCMTKRTMYIVLCMILCACLMAGIGYYILHKRAVGAVVGGGPIANGGGGGGGANFGDMGQYGGGGGPM